MIQIFNCNIFLKILYLAPGSSKEFCTNMGFFVQSQIYHLQLSVILFRYVTFFAVFHSSCKVLIPETILTRRLITKAKTISYNYSFQWKYRILQVPWQTVNVTLVSYLAWSIKMALFIFFIFWTVPSYSELMVIGKLDITVCFHATPVHLYIIPRGFSYLIGRKSTLKTYPSAF